MFYVIYQSLWSTDMQIDHKIGWKNDNIFGPILLNKHGQILLDRSVSSESQKAKTLQIARFLSQKLSG